MPPSSSEFNNNYSESDQHKTEKKPYLDIERGDVYVPPSNNNDDDTNSTNQAAPTSSQTQIQQQAQQNKPLDPVELVKNLISTGFTPTRAQIAGANANLAGASDSSNTWFSIFLQRLIKQNKKRKL